MVDDKWKNNLHGSPCKISELLRETDKINNPYIENLREVTFYSKQILK
jgi:hypothetical protein